MHSSVDVESLSKQIIVVKGLSEGLVIFDSGCYAVDNTFGQEGPNGSLTTDSVRLIRMQFPNEGFQQNS